MAIEFPYKADWGADVLKSTDWSATLTAYGNGLATREVLSGELASPAVMQHLLSAVVHQATLFPVAEPVVRFLLPLCMDRVESLTRFQPFWTEWLEGVDMVAAEYEVTPSMLKKAQQAVRASACDEDELDFLYQDLSPGTPMSVLHNYTYQQAALVRPWVASLVGQGD